VTEKIFESKTASRRISLLNGEIKTMKKKLKQFVVAGVALAAPFHCTRKLVRQKFRTPMAMPA
jgi:hypothetical protein